MTTWASSLAPSPGRVDWDVPGDPLDDMQRAVDLVVETSARRVARRVARAQDRAILRQLVDHCHTTVRAWWDDRDELVIEAGYTVRVHVSRERSLLHPDPWALLLAVADELRDAWFSSPRPVLAAGIVLGEN